MAAMGSFFTEWDLLELQFPWGVNVLGPFLSRFGVNPHFCDEIDSRIFLDLATRVQPAIRRIRVESRYTPSQFWIRVMLCGAYMLVSFQRRPNAPVERSMAVAATPCLLMACIVAFHGWELGSRGGACWQRTAVGRERTR
jgi:hypothetical protein